ncbi:hypothetical protein HHK36_029961 [Tetracentron sinense]|uniref:DUF7054 domain-containing protein n=1 Tax=Tetracentron sinense TaxID=13715 RepID=A0A835D332_TETSI|nr:hypothetical protein HHK36_029961 [Tetracentron sinense]
MLLQKQKKNGKGSRLLITVNVLGSSGPVRFLVNEEELVATVIDTALRSYAREGRLPVLSSDLNNFLLYCTNTESEALSPWETIGSRGGRNFVLYKKQQQQQQLEKTTEPEMKDGDGSSTVITRKGSGSWKAWLNKSLNLKISSH